MRLLGADKLFRTHSMRANFLSPQNLEENELRRI
jgi:hypothetical protein